MAISQSTLSAIKAAALSPVVEACGAPTKRVGHEFLTQCLWHEDTNPSLTISDQKGFCFCHVCRKKADAIDYVQEIKGFTWREAVEFTADVLGVIVETDNEDPEAAARRKVETQELIEGAHLVLGSAEPVRVRSAAELFEADV